MSSFISSIDSAKMRKPPPPDTGTILASAAPTNEKKFMKTTYNCESLHYSDNSSSGDELREVLGKKHRTEIMLKGK